MSDHSEPEADGDDSVGEGTLGSAEDFVASIEDSLRFYNDPEYDNGTPLEGEDRLYISSYADGMAFFNNLKAGNPLYDQVVHQLDFDPLTR